MAGEGSLRNCTAGPVETDAGVAGSGVLLSFIITNCLALVLSSIIILLGLRKSTSAPICRKLLSSFSDQQIITGIGIQCVGLAKMNTMVPYHFFIVWLLSLLSTATNLSTLLALVNDFKRDWVLRWLRQFLMFVNLLLGCVTGVFVLRSVMMNLEPTIPIGCIWDVKSREGASAVPLSTVGTIAVIAANLIVFILGTWYLHNRSNPKWLKGIQVVGLLILIATGIGATARVIMVSQAFGTPSINLIGRSEKEWSFGQLLAILLLVLPLINTVEIIRGEVRTPPSHVDEDQQPLFDGELQNHKGNGSTGYQPNPIWGEQAGLFRK